MARHATVTGAMPFEVQVAAGLIPGWSILAIHGHDPAAAQAEAILAHGNATDIINPIPLLNTPATVKVASTDDTKDIAAGVGANTILLTGLDATGDAQTETVTLHASSGQTAVVTSSTWSAINGMTVATAGSETDNSGTIWCGTGTFTSGVPAVGLVSAGPGTNYSHTGHYTVPTNHALYLRNAQMSGNGASAFKGVESDLFIYSVAAGVSYEIFEMHFGDGASMTITGLLQALPAGTLVMLRGGAIAQTAGVTFRVDGYLRDLSHTHSWGS